MDDVIHVATTKT